MIEMQRLLELEWQMAVKQNDKECIRTAADNCLFHIFTYCESLRGYETPNVLPHDLRHHILSPDESAVLSEQGNYSPSHVSLPLLGRFKARSQEEQHRIMDICWDTKYFLQKGIWAQKIIRIPQGLWYNTGLGLSGTI